MSDLNRVVWMTLDVRRQLTRELEELNASHANSLAETARMDGRIREIEILLRQAEVGTKPDDGLVEPGMEVTVRFDTDGTSHTFLIGTRELLTRDPSITIDVFSPESPLGAAIIGRYPGQRASYLAPSGSTVGVEVVAAKPFANGAVTDFEGAA
ncbi:GreA/GreB family elongation factor [Leifsonia poae]|uniref:GreA/GreB family elongation factor n=1 Tax=Leifsonia poae TaxID=110933 RepID=UPI001CBCD826|nr:GreA/GreB family elongation factor [Leifsonia poae]